MTEILDIPTKSLKETLNDLKTIVNSTTGQSCPRCGGTDFNKAGFQPLLGKRSRKLRCLDCGYTFGVSELSEEFSQNRASRIFNLNNKRPDDYIESAMQYGILKKCEDTKYIKTKTSDRVSCYRNVPIFNHLITSLGASPKRSDFERSLKQFPDENLKLSSIKRDVLWRRYKEIAIEVFICDKCNFSRTCKKNHKEILVCDTVKKTKQKSWAVDIKL